MVGPRGFDLELLQEGVRRMAQLHEAEGREDVKGVLQQGEHCDDQGAPPGVAQDQVQEQFGVDAEVEGPPDEKPNGGLEQSEDEELPPEVAPGVYFPKGIISPRWS
jgi:hypothetical protein